VRNRYVAILLALVLFMGAANLLATYLNARQRDQDHNSTLSTLCTALRSVNVSDPHLHIALGQCR
jgi:hypothetical protein